jgi:hypothetical protein
MPRVSTLPDDPIVAGWWREQERRARWDVVADELRAVREAKARVRRLRQLRRRVERVNEMICLAENASKARRNLRSQGVPFDDWARTGWGERGRRSAPTSSAGSRSARSRDGVLREPGHGTDARHAGPIEHGPVGRVLGVR